MQAETNNKNNSCQPLPQNLSDCCKIPALFDDESLGNCEYFCSNDNKNKDNPDCPLTCIFKNSKSITPQGLNRSALVQAYLYRCYPTWVPIINQGFDLCFSLLNASNLKESYEKFEDCINPHFENHCIQFNSPLECDKVEDYMDKCQNIHQNCSVWPSYITKIPEPCCSGRPELFNASLISQAELYCLDQDVISRLGRMYCHSTYLLNVTGLKVNKTWHFSLATKYLSEHSTNLTNWKAAIDKAVAVCEKQVHG